MKWDDYLAVKWAAYLLAISHGILGWDEAVQHNGRTHPLAYEIRCCLDTNIATPLTPYLLLDKPNKAVWQQEMQQHLHSAKH